MRYWNCRGALALLLLVAFVASVSSHDDLQRAADPPSEASLHAELRTLLTEERASLDELQSEFERSHDERDALAIQREIRKVKLATQREVMAAQLRYAKAHGDELARADLERRIRDLEQMDQLPQHTRRDRPLPAPAAN